LQGSILEFKLKQSVLRSDKERDFSFPTLNLSFQLQILHHERPPEKILHLTGGGGDFLA